MKFKVGDQVLVTAGKDKGMKSTITAVIPDENKVVVEGVNCYIKHVKPMPMINRPGERVRLERPLNAAKIAIINDEGNRDRIGYKVDSKGNKSRVFKKTGKPVPDQSKDQNKQDGNEKNSNGEKE